MGVGVDRRRLCLPLPEWPDRDRALWARGVERGSVLDAAGPGSRWRPRTVQTVVEGYGYALAWLLNNDLLLGELAPEARWTTDRLRNYIRDLQGRVRLATVLNRVIALERALAVLAPTSDRSQLRAAIRN